jgi:hypothetical protein
MNTKINLTYKGEQYTLEYNRMSIKMLEKAGFEYDKFLDQPVTNIELAFTGAFVKNHPKIKQTVVDEIFDSCPNKNELVATISKMINECYESLLAEPDEKSEGNASWEVVDLSPKKKETVAK